MAPKPEVASETVVAEQKAVEILSGGAFRQPQVPKGCEWLGDVVRDEVQRSINPLWDDLLGIKDTIDTALSALWRIVEILLVVGAVIVVIVVAGVLLGLLLMFRILSLVGQAGRLMNMVASLARERGEAD